MRTSPWLGLPLAAILGGCMTLQDPPSPGRPASSVASRLDALHAAAANADAEAYWACFAPDAVFLGTDDTERWTLEQFKAYADPYFARGQGWTYTPVPDRRFIRLAEDFKTAWFDEALDNEKYGRCRGSGVLTSHAQLGWRVVQYNLTFTVPNDLAEQITATIKAHRSTPLQVPAR